MDTDSVNIFQMILYTFLTKFYYIHGSLNMIFFGFTILHI